jgi:hypothetical protein
MGILVIFSCCFKMEIFYSHKKAPNAKTYSHLALPVLYQLLYTQTGIGNINL